MERKSRPWFAAKTHGYGSGLPITWQGWLALMLLMATAPSMLILFPGIVGWGIFVLLMLAFALLCAFKTEGGWRWRWGDRDG